MVCGRSIEFPDHPAGRGTLKAAIVMLTTKQLMLVNPISVSPTTPISEVRQLMESEGARQLTVLQDGKLVGIITDRDLCMAIHEYVQSSKVVADCMTPDPLTVSPDTPIYRAAQIMSTYKFSALPVIENERLVGLITSSLLLGYFASNLENR